MALVEDLKAGQPFGANGSHYRAYYNDQLGAVSHDELEAFAQALLLSEGKADRRPMRIYSLMRLSRDELYSPYYVLTLERVLWQTKSYETNDMLLPVEVENPHWEVEHSSWLIGFRGNEITSARQVDELFFLHGELEPVKGCSTE